MTTKIIHKKSSVAGKVPLATDLEVGELAINLADKKIFSKDTANTVIELAPNSGGGGSTVDLDYIDFDTAAGYTVSAGQIAWNAQDQTFDMGLSNGVTLQAGQELHYYVKATEAITNGQVVYASGAVGNSGAIEVKKYIANGTIDELYALGVATQDIANGSFGYITLFGKVRELNTSGSTVGETWVDGTILYASPTTAGAVTSVKPIAPNLAIPVIMVVSSHASNGTLFIRAFSSGYHLKELHDVHAPNPTNGQALVWNSATSRWEAGTVSGGGGASALDDLTDVVITSPSSGQVLKFNGTSWVNGTDSTGGGGGGAATLVVSDTAPSSPTQGTLWFNSADATLMLWYEDGTSNQWIEIVGSQGPTGPDANISKALAMTFVFN